MFLTWYEDVEFNLSPTGIENGIGQEFTILDSESKVDDDPMYVLSARGIPVRNHNKEVVVAGYMGDVKGVRPPDDMNGQFGIVLWYIFKDVDGNYSDALTLSMH